MCLCDAVFHVRVAPSVCLGGSKAEQLGDAFGKWLCHGPQRNMPCRASAITLKRKGWSTVDRIGQAMPALALCLLVAHLSSIHYCLGNSWSYITHMNTRLKTTFSYVAWSPVFSRAPVMVNLQRFGGVFEFALKGEMSMWTKMVVGTPRNQKLFHDVSDMPCSRDENENESPDPEHVEDSGARSSGLFIIWFSG